MEPSKQSKYVFFAVLIVAMPLLYFFSEHRANTIIDVKDMKMNVNLVEFSNCSYMETDRICTLVVQAEDGTKYKTKVALDAKMEVVKLSDVIVLDYKRVTTTNMYERKCLSKLSYNDTVIFEAMVMPNSRPHKVKDQFSDCHLVESMRK